MNCIVVVSRRAERDIREIRDWICARSPQGARRWIDALEATLNRLSGEAVTSPRAAEADEFPGDLRQRTFKTRRGRIYRLVFLLRGDTVYVLSVRGAGQELLAPGELELPD